MPSSIFQAPHFQRVWMETRQETLKGGTGTEYLGGGNGVPQFLMTEKVQKAHPFPCLLEAMGRGVATDGRMLTSGRALGTPHNLHLAGPQVPTAISTPVPPGLGRKWWGRVRRLPGTGSLSVGPHPIPRSGVLVLVVNMETECGSGPWGDC